jgi:hypothetical protein
MYSDHKSAYRWRQCHSPQANHTFRKKPIHLPDRHAANIRISGIVIPEIVPQDATSRLRKSPHPVGKKLTELVIQKGSEYGRLEHNIEGSLR